MSNSKRHRSDENDLFSIEAQITEFKTSPCTKRQNSQTDAYNWTSNSLEVFDDAIRKSPPSSTTSEEGWKITNKFYVAPLCHQNGIPLLNFFAKESTTKSPFRPFKDVSKQHDLTAWEEIFARNYSMEKGLLNVAINSKLRSEMESEGYEIGKPGQKIVGNVGSCGNSGRTDINISQKESKHPIALIEIGMEYENWWAKVGQGVKYINMLRFQKWKRFLFTKSILLIVLSYDNKSKSARLGAFLCWKIQNNVNVSLLWRNATNRSDDLANAFTTAINGIYNLAALHRSDFSDEHFAALGPNCCCFTSTSGKIHVFRCYDSRMRQTDQCTTIYEMSSEIFHSEQENRHMIGTPYIYLDVRSEYLMRKESEEFTWTFSVSVIILEIPFIQGGHVPIKVGDFLPIIDEMERLHRKNYVHGDIRLFNIVFSELGGSLIDFDFGGKANKQRYPKRYENALIDGTRMGTPGEYIQVGHDWHALVNLIFIILTPEVPMDEDINTSIERISSENKNFRPDEFKALTDKEQRNSILDHEVFMKASLREIKMKAIENATELTDDVQIFINELTRFLERRKEWKFAITTGLKLFVKDHTHGQPTGSPPKQIGANARIRLISA